MTQGDVQLDCSGESETTKAAFDGLGEDETTDTKSVEQSVKEFYDGFGWVEQGSDAGSGEDQMFRSFLEPHSLYHHRVDQRTRECLDGYQGHFLIAGGGDLPEPHIELSKPFDRVTCLDISVAALEIARQKLAGRAEYVEASVLDIPRVDATFDACYFAHVLYHIGDDLQHKAIEEPIRVMKPGGRIVIAYRNPRSFGTLLLNFRNWLEDGFRSLFRRPSRHVSAEMDALYYHCHPLNWWQQFDSRAERKFVPWDVFSNEEEALIFRNDFVARIGYKVCSCMENVVPGLAVRLWSYVVITLTVKPS